MDNMKIMIKNLLEEQEQRFQKNLAENMEKFTARLEKIEYSILGNKNDIKNLEKEMTDIKQSLIFWEDVVETKLKELHERIDFTIEENAMLKDNLRRQEDRNRRNNLRIDGIKENEGETAKDVEEKVRKLFRESLGIKHNIEIERAHRTGRRTPGNKQRTIVMKVLRYKDKLEVLKEARKLKNSKIWINEDFSKVTAEIRKNLMSEIKRRRMKGEEGLVLRYDQIRKFTRNDNNNNNMNDD